MIDASLSANFMKKYAIIVKIISIIIFFDYAIMGYLSFLAYETSIMTLQLFTLIVVCLAFLIYFSILFLFSSIWEYKMIFEKKYEASVYVANFKIAFLAFYAISSIVTILFISHLLISSLLIPPLCLMDGIGLFNLIRRPNWQKDVGRKITNDG